MRTGAKAWASNCARNFACLREQVKCASASRTGEHVVHREASVEAVDKLLGAEASLVHVALRRESAGLHSAILLIHRCSGSRAFSKCSCDSTLTR
eukprot:1503431-Pleurochrysis_carterae.AAC.8